MPIGCVAGKVRRMTVVGSEKMVVYDAASTEAKIQLFDKGIDRKNIRGRWAASILLADFN